MRATAQLHEVAAMRFLEANSRFHQGELNCVQAAELMGVSVSTFYRKRQRFAEEGEGGLVDRRIGKMSARRVPVDEAMHAITLFETRYYDFTVKHYHRSLLHVFLRRGRHDEFLPGQHGKDCVAKMHGGKRGSATLRLSSPRRKNTLRLQTGPWAGR